jgi:AP-4 complex subunit mu-1
MISSFFVLSPRGDMILSKMYHTRPEVGAHERSHTEAFFQKVKFWNDMQAPSSFLMNSSTSEFLASGNGNADAAGGTSVGTAASVAGMEQGSGNTSDAAAGGGGVGGTMKKKKKDPPPVFIMPDGKSYFHINRNGLLFACSTDKNVSPCTVIEVSLQFA